MNSDASEELDSQQSSAEVIAPDFSNRKEPRGKLYCYNWLSGISDSSNYDIVEVQFKNTRKGFYKNSQHIDLNIGDMVAVEANPGHDIGQVTMVGKLVALQMRKANLHPDYEIRRVFRKARQSDLEKYEEAKSREHDTMIRSRKIAEELELNMKIGDVEYQGDGSKAIFYYIADDRVDFRQLIKVFAEEFRVRIEMKQIGARQEAGRIGGIGPCGRELCCTTWMSNFVSVSTTAARYQDLSTNPLKLAGQCAKIKCCVNFEAPMYVDAQKDFPPKDIPLETIDGTYYFFKADVFKRQLTYSSDQNIPANLQVISVERAKEIMAINRRGEKVVSLVEKEGEATASVDYQNVVGQDSLTRFDKKQGGEHRRFDRRDRGGRDGYRNGGRRANGQQSNEHRSNYRNRREEGNE